MSKFIIYEKLLKDVELEPQTGGEGDICDREDLQNIVSDPFLRVVQYLYDINVQTQSCGSNARNEIGISCNYETLNAENKKIVDEYLGKKGLKLIAPNPPHCPNFRFRISVDVDMNVDTVADAEKKLFEEVKEFGLVKQDVLFGKESVQQAIKVAKKAYFDNSSSVSINEVLELLCELGKVIDNEYVWYSKELYEKHLDYQKEQKKKADEEITKEENFIIQ